MVLSLVYFDPMCLYVFIPIYKELFLMIGVAIFTSLIKYRYHMTQPSTIFSDEFKNSQTEFL